MVYIGILMKTKKQDIFSKIQIAKENPNSIYIQLAENIKRLISNCELPADESIPSERALAKNLELNRGTVRKAMELLVNENVLERKGNRLLVSQQFIMAEQSAIARIGIVLFCKFSFFFDKNLGALDFIQGITDACGDFNAIPQILQAPEVFHIDESSQKWLDFVQDNTDILIHLGTRIEDLEEQDEVLRRILMIDKPQGCVLGHFNIGKVMPVLPNENSGIIEAARMLAGLGHKNICVIGWQQWHGSLFVGNNFSRTERMQAHCRHEGMNTVLVTLDPSNHFQRDLRQRLEKIIDSQEGVTAFLCANDHIAEQVINQLKNLGISVPDDISVVGYDDMKGAREFQPPLTTICHPRYEIGYESVRRTLEVFKKNQDRK